MQIERRKLAQITPYENNPRKNDQAVDAVARSIREFGFRQPIVVDREGVIICGHVRYLAAQQLGLAIVPVHVAGELSPAQAKALRIADNRSAELATWDYELLPIELAELQGMDFDLDLVGFSPDELAKLLEPEVAGGLTDPDEVPEPPDDPVTQPGDLWILGDHRLLCGDSGKAEDIDRLLDGAKIQLCNTDPPYNVKVQPRSNNAIAAGMTSFSRRADLQCSRSMTERGKKDRERLIRKHRQKSDVERDPENAKPTQKKMRAKDRPLENDFVSQIEFDRLLDAWCGNIARVLQAGRSLYIWGGYANCANYPPVLRAHDLYFTQAIIWDKEHPVLTRKDRIGSCVERVGSRGGGERWLVDNALDHQSGSVRC